MLLLAIDGNSLLNRAFFGVRPLTTREGIPTNAIFGFLNILKKLEKEYVPDGVAVCFDVARKTFRNDLYADYKGTRKGMPEELAIQLPLLKTLLTALGYPILGQEGFEADDLLGTIARACEQTNNRCVVATGDRDSFQLISPLVRVHLAGKMEALYDEKAIRDSYGVNPAQMIEVKSIMGDPSDNIPGVAGIGEKGALKLISKFGDLDGVYAHLEEEGIPPRQKQLLIEHKETAYLSRTLAIIRRDVPLPCGIEELIRGPVHQADASAMLKKLELYSMYDRLGVSQHPSVSEQELKTFVRCSETAFWEGLDGQTAVGVALNDGPDEPGIGAFAAAGKYYETDCAGVCRGLRQKHRFVAFDSKSLWHRVRAAGGLLPEGTEDLMLMAYLQNPTASTYTSDRMLEEGNFSLAMAGAKEAGFRAAGLSLLLPVWEKKLEDCQAKSLYETVERPLALVLARMEDLGFRIDKPGIARYSDTLEQDIAALEEQIYLLAGHPFNLGSPKQLGTVLFEELQLPAGKKNKTGYSTNADVLEQLTDRHPIAALLLEHRQLTKLKSTYTNTLIEQADENDRVHTSFLQAETRTGRISSQNPNLQNIPVRTERGRELRRFFVAEPGKVLVDADYSQIELRVLAHLSCDPAMCRAFRENTDIHTQTAMEVFQMPAAFVTPLMRRRAKAVNFGIVYGMGAFRLAHDISVPLKEAKAYIDRYFETYAGVAAFMENAVRQAEEKGYSETLFGRRRPIPELKVTNKVQKAMAQRIARNSPIQGTAADIIKIAMVRVDEALKRELPEARLVLQVHDELIVECPAAQASLASALLEREMANAAALSVPLPAEAHTGATWYAAKEG